MTPRAQILAKAKQSLDTFLASSATFHLVHSVSPAQASSTSGSSAPKTLFILDSSFNPPSNAHLSLATSALRASQERYPTPHRLLLLFSVHNADKSPAPAAFEQRLAMMMVFAEDIARRMQTDATDIDIGLTTQPYYNDKSTAIEDTDAYTGNPQHIHLVGYDTFVRIFEPKYYKGHTPPLSALTEFFSRHGLRITSRPEEQWGETEEQKEFWRKLARGDMEADGARKEWADRIEMVESDADGVGVSSTSIRQAVSKSDWQTVRQMCTESVAEWTEEMKLYATTQGR